MGNHDKLGINKLDELRFCKESNIYILHKEVMVIDYLRVAGISGIIGNNRKPNRVEEYEYLDSLKTMLLQKPNIILLHESPDFPNDNFDGNENIRKTIEVSAKNLIICGHKYWRTPLKELSNGTQILNVNERVVVLIKQ